MVSEKELELLASKKKNSKKNSLTLFYIIVIIIVAFGTLAMSAFIFFKVEYIESNETSRYTSESIIELSGIEKGDNLVFLNVETIENRIYLEFPYIDEVTVTKLLPATIRIEVEEAAAYYSVEYEDSYVLVSGQGKLLEIVDEPQEGTAHIIAGEIWDNNGIMEFVDEQTQEYLSEIMDIISTREDGEITLIDLSNIYDIVITYDDRVEIQLGGASDLDYKLKFAFQIIDEGNIGEYDEGTLDVSYGREVNRAFLNVKENIPEGVIIDPELDEDSSDGTSEEEDSSDSTSEDEDISTEPSATPAPTSNRGNDIPDVVD
ncbi:MAG: FtsQ-type POTRA domain-containing protein [Clostridia bacterium]